MMNDDERKWIHPAALAVLDETFRHECLAGKSYKHIKPSSTLPNAECRASCGIGGLCDAESKWDDAGCPLLTDEAKQKLDDYDSLDYQYSECINVAIPELERQRNEARAEVERWKRATRVYVDRLERYRKARLYHPLNERGKALERQMIQAEVAMRDGDLPALEKALGLEKE